MEKVTTDVLFLPQKEERRVICGVTLVEWYFAVVYVHQKDRSYEPPTQMYFTFLGAGDYYLDEVVALVDQWTYRRGQCLFTITVQSHEFYRARKMACQAVGTYRNNYLNKHGSPPNPLCLKGTLDQNLIKKRIRHKITPSPHGQQLNLSLDS